MPQKRYLRASGGKPTAMTGDISARRGALAIKNQHRLTSVKWLMALSYSRGSRTATRPKQRPGASLPTLKLADRIRLHDPSQLAPYDVDK